MAPSDEAFWEEAFGILASADNELEVKRQIAFLAGIYPGLRDPSAAQRAIRSQLDRLRRPQRRRSDPAPRIVAPTAPKMSASERTVFLALLEPELRGAALEALRDEDLMETQAAADLAKALAASFQDGPPEGAPAAWMARIEPEEQRQAFADLVLEHQAKASAGQIPETIPEPFLLDALRKLSVARQRRQIQQLKGQELDDDRLRELAERLKRAQQRNDS